MLFTTSATLDIVLITFFLSLLLWKYLTRQKNFWKFKGVDFKVPTFPLGNLGDVIFLRKSIGDWFQELYNSTSSPFLGIYLFDEPGLVLRSPDIIKDVLIKDFNFFIDRSVAYPTHNEISRSMMFFQRGREWKNMRAKMTPVFTSGKLKSMSPILNHYGMKLVECLKRHKDETDVKAVISDYVLDAITKCFFGIETHSLDDKESEFKRMINEVMNPKVKISWSRIFYIFYQKVVVPLRLSFVENRHLNYFCDAFLKAIEARAGCDKKVNDFIDIINDLKKDEAFSKDFNFFGRGTLGQPFMFFIAGHNTTTATITYALYEFSKNPEVQQKVRHEKLDVLGNCKEVNYDALVSMKYLDMCVLETLRKYPPLPYLDRRSDKPYKIRDTDVTIPAGLSVYIPLMGLHYDEEYFPEPEKFIPERFTPSSNVNKDICFAPFGLGHRSCIGERLGMLNTKMALAHILSNFAVEPTDTTPDILIFDPKVFTLETFPGAVQLYFKPLEK